MLGATTDEGMQLRPLQLGALGLICTIAFWWTVPWGVEESRCPVGTCAKRLSH
eukprot:COSAG01_NODE_49143_length_374_cov_5.443636_1_plen_53_part_00